VATGPGRSGGGLATETDRVLRLGLGAEQPLRLLLIGAHSDDIEIGCGGTVLSLLRQRTVAVRWVVFSATGDRELEARRSAAAFLEGAAECDVRTCGFRDGFFPYEGAAVKEFFETLKTDMRPDLIFTHRLDDRHQDHRLLAELTWNTFRDHAILEYEIPKYEGDLGHPNLFVPLEADVSRRKLALLMTMFGTQRSKRWFTEELFAAVMTLRGAEAGLAGGHAEGFHARKLLLEL
jgi:LmbE family N-acetylglucosaminyl deacetylase